MANWSQSHFLQSLGWATLNSFWQMALLWCLFLGANHIFKFSSHRKYQFSVMAIATGFAWFVFTLVYYYNSKQVTLAFFDHTIRESNNLLNIFLISSSVTYLSLLIFPSYRLYKNWKFVQRIRKNGLSKADYNYRLFVQKIASQLGITKKVAVYVSELVNSPLTVGYIKPIILLPVAALNHLSTQQVEAILLHELSHIRRFDYLVNLMISVISTILYFNPFVKIFVRIVEEERENCCDELVLQYGYDKVGYATALLTLEKLSVHRQVLALGAAGAKYLVNRIEKIVGMEKKKGWNRNQLAGMFAALFCIIVFNSVLIIKETNKEKKNPFAFSSISTPFSLYENDRGSQTPVMNETNPPQKAWIAKTSPVHKINSKSSLLLDAAASEEVVFGQFQPSMNPVLSFVGQDDVDAALTEKQKEEVRITVENTRKVISGFQWAEIEKSIADALNEKEKQKAHEEYMKALERTVDFKSLEQNMKAKYQEMDMARINSNLDKAIVMMQLDSLQKSYQSILVQLEKANEELRLHTEIAATPMPDNSIDELKRSTEEMRRKIDTINALRHPKKVVRL